MTARCLIVWVWECVWEDWGELVQRRNSIWISDNTQRRGKGGFWQQPIYRETDTLTLKHFLLWACHFHSHFSKPNQNRSRPVIALKTSFWGAFSQHSQHFLSNQLHKRSFLALRWQVWGSLRLPVSMPEGPNPICLLPNPQNTQKSFSIGNKTFAQALIQVRMSPLYINNINIKDRFLKPKKLRIHLSCCQTVQMWWKI